MVDEKKLIKKIADVEIRHGGNINIERAKVLIEKVQAEYKNGKQTLGFKNLVERCTEELELHYNYCRVTFAYLGGNKKEKESMEDNNSTEHLQTLLF